MPATTSTTLEPALFPGLIQHYPDYHILYCKPCTAVVFPKGLYRHLQGFHQVLPAQRLLLVQHCQSLDLIARPEDLQLQPDYSLALRFLPIQQGYSCSRCRFLSSSRDSIRQHINKAHKLFQQACTNSYERAQLQSWFIGPRAQY